MVNTSTYIIFSHVRAAHPAQTKMKATGWVFHEHKAKQNKMKPVNVALNNNMTRQGPYGVIHFKFAKYSVIPETKQNKYIKNYSTAETQVTTRQEVQPKAPVRTSITIAELLNA